MCLGTVALLVGVRSEARLYLAETLSGLWDVWQIYGNVSFFLH